MLILALDRNRWYPPRGANRKKKTNSYTTVKCGKRPTKIYTCDIFQGPCLFNVRTDPCEYHDLSAKKPGYLKIMIKKLQKYKNSMVKSRHIDRIDKRSNPKRHGGVWKPWIMLWLNNLCWITTIYYAFHRKTNNVINIFYWELNHCLLRC